MRALVVEDEPRILKNLQQLLGDYQHLAVCGCAENSVDALALLATCTPPPDLLITDIRMAGMDGLGLIEAARELYPTLAYIIISGYSDFAYARQALVLGVCEYLLKPVKAEELFTALDSLHERIIRGNLEKSLEIAQSVGIPHAAETIKDKLNVLVMLCVAGFPIHSAYNIERTDFWDDNHIEQLAAAVRCAQYWVIEGKTPVEKSIVFSFERQTPYDVQRALEAFFATLCALDAPITMVYQKDFGSLYSVGSQAKALRQQLRSQLVPGMSQLLQANAPRAQLSLSPFFTGQENLLLRLQSKQTDEFCGELHSIVQSMDMLQMPQALIAKFFTQLAERACTLLQIPFDTDLENSLADALLLAEDFSTLARNLESVFTELQEAVLHSQQHRETREQLLRFIDIYIRENYSSPINTQSLAEHFALSPAYLSKIFRNYKQLSPVEYITKIRMENAQHLLQTDGKLSVKAVAALVGYEDPFYFSKVFKKFTGYPPTEHVRQ